MKKLEKKEMQTIQGGADSCFSFCAAQFNNCIASGTPRAVCREERAECWLICPIGV